MNRKNKLIIICGVSTSGKSSTSKSVYKQLLLNNIACEWMHEEISNHPIRNGEFEKDSIYTFDGMQKNVQDMYLRWKQLVRKIIDSPKVFILEGCFFQSIIRYFLDSVFKKKQIIEYYREVTDILTILNPLIVLLYRPDIQTSFENAYKIRGDNWKKCILNKPTSTGYFTRVPYTGDESVYQKENEYQMIAKEIIDEMTTEKLKIDTSKSEWSKYVSQIIEKMGYRYFPIENKKVENPGRYCGKYEVNDQGYSCTISIKYDERNGKLYCSSFWPYMEMINISTDTFELLSFPITLSFEIRENERKVNVSGTYDWKLMGKTMTEVTDKIVNKDQT